jgi:hypothetical protein
MSHVRTPTLVPGAPGHVMHPQTEPHDSLPPLEPKIAQWLAIAEHVAVRFPGIATKLSPGPGGPSGHIIALWIVLAATVVALASHIVGEGTVRAKLDRMEKIVEWLGKRAIAEDRGAPPPEYPLL